MFGKKTMHDEYAKAVSEIDEGQRREPQHQWPDGTHSKWSHINPVDQLVFDEFAWFGAILDRSTSDAWSFESTADTGRRAWYLDSPEYGRRWNIFYNDLKMGWMEVSANPDRLFGTAEDFLREPLAQVDMNLDLMQFVPSEDALGILYQTAFFMQGTQDGHDTARERARVKAESAMTLHMWNVMRAGNQYVPELDYSVEGSYAVYRETVSHWQTTGYDPLRREG